MKQRFFNPKTGSEVGEPMGTERAMRGFDKKPVAKKPVMKPGSRPMAHHPHDIVGARKKPHMPTKGRGEQPPQTPDVAPNYDATPPLGVAGPAAPEFRPPSIKPAPKLPGPLVKPPIIQPNPGSTMSGKPLRGK